MAVAGSGEDVNMTGDFAQFDLVREIADSERQKPWSAGIHARILTKKPDFRVVLVSMETAARLEEHHVDGTSAVQVLKGHIRYRTGGQAYDLQAESLITLGASIRARGRIAGRIRIPADPLLAGQPATACFSGMKERAPPTKLIVMTIGPPRTSREFIQILKAHQVRRTVTLLMHKCGDREPTG